MAAAVEVEAVVEMEVAVHREVGTEVEAKTISVRASYQGAMSPRGFQKVSTNLD